MEDEFRSFVKKFKSRLRKLKRKEQTWEPLVNKIQRVYEDFDEIVKLNVRGKLFSVSKHTLMSMDSTYFYGLIANSDKFKPSEDGSFFIERNPLVFDRILDYLRTGKMDTRDMTLYALDMLKDDLDYYCIPSPTELQLHWDVTKKPNNCILSYDNLTITKSNGTGSWNCGVIGNVAVDKYTIHINEKVQGHIMIGFSTGTKWNRNGQNYNTNGWFLSIENGSVHGNDVKENRSGDAKSSVDSSSSSSDDDSSKEEEELRRRFSFPQIKSGDLISVIRLGNTIRFENNNIDLGISRTFSADSGHPLFPAIDIRDLKCSLSLVIGY